MQSYNLFFLTRNQDSQLFARTESLLSGRGGKISVKEHEKKSVRALVDCLCEFHPALSLFDGFVFSYSIPHIGKEFDLLKITEKGVLNIELKSINVGKNAIREQLIKNRYYLHHLSGSLSLFTYVMRGNLFFTLDENNHLVETDASELLRVLECHSTRYETEFDQLFEACDYLISPAADAQRFIEGNYFLTQQQQMTKKKILGALKDNILFTAITGNAGTGKTLLLYDLAKILSRHGGCCFLHPNALCAGHLALEKGIPGLVIRSVDTEDPLPDPQRFEYIFLDEAHRIGQKTFSALTEKCWEHSIHCFFTYDKKLYLTEKERRTGIPEQIEKLKKCRIYRLSNTVRSNKKLSDLTEALFDKKYLKHSANQKILSIVYLPEGDIRQNKTLENGRFKDEFDRALAYFEEQGLPIIDCRTGKGVSPMLFVGAEYSEVVVLLDGKFFYDKHGKLHASKEGNELPLNILRCAISRARERLTLVVTDKELYRQLLELLEK